MGTAWAQGADATSAAPAILNLAPIALLIGIFYMLLWRPEQKRRKEHEAVLAGLRRNDHVVLSSGVHGRVVGLGDKVVSVEVAPKIAVQVDRAAIQRVEQPPAGEQREKEREKS